MENAVSQTERMILSSSGITTINIYSDQKDNIYYVEEDITITAEFGNPSAVKYVRWKKNETNTNFSSIATTSPKYTGTRYENFKHLLMIRKCCESDTGSYSLLVTCIDDVDITSNSIDIKVVRDHPKVALNEVPSACPYDCVNMIATIRSYPKHTSIIWKKGNKPIDITLTKYAGSLNVGDRPVLCINNVKEDDGDVYTIEVQNALGKGTCNEELFVIGVRQMIFISGPVVVSPSETINFQAFLPDRKFSIAKWWKITKQSTTEIQPDTKKYLLYQRNKIHAIEIINAEKGDSAAYQFSLDTMKSNKIHTFVDDSGKYTTSKQGNCLRLFALQAVSADAMRKVFDNPNDFEDKKTRLKQYCESNLTNPRNNELFSRLVRKKGTSLNDADISLMYVILRNSVVQKPKNGWGKRPEENDIGLADDIERIHQCRNLICHTDASEIETTLFNKTVLDLSGAIRRLSKDNVKLIEDTCDILNKVFAKGKDMELMIEKLKTFKKEQQTFDQLLIEEYNGNTYTQKTERSNQNNDVKFHDVCDSDIVIMDDGTTATQAKLYRSGVCFMNRPLTLKDEIQIHGKPTDFMRHKDHAEVKIGLTNKDPNKIRSSTSKIEACGSILSKVDEDPEHYVEISFNEFHLCISLRRDRNATLSLKLNGTRQFYHSYPNVSTADPMWLVIQPYGIKSIKISNIVK